MRTGPILQQATAAEAERMAAALVSADVDGAARLAQYLERHLSAEPLGRFAEAFQEVGDERRRGRLPLGAGDGHDPFSVRVVEPEVERGADRDAVGFQVEHVGAVAWNAGALEDDVAGEQRLVAAVAIDQHARCHVRGVVDDDDAGRDVVDARQRGAPLDAVTEDAHAPGGEASEASGPEHGSVLVG